MQCHAAQVNTSPHKVVALMGLHFLCLGLTQASAQTPEITLAAASSTQPFLQELLPRFTAEKGIEAIAVYGASGKLATQILNGAPFHVFVSADMDFPDSLFRWGHAQAKPKAYAYGKIVLWSLKPFDASRGLGFLAEPAIARIALADPKRAPYGREGRRALQSAGLYDRVSSKLVYGENINQAAQYIVTGHADIGFCAKSVVLAEAAQGKGHWVEVDSTLYHPIAQGAVISRYGRANDSAAAATFYAYLFSPAARSLLLKYGYVLPVP
jgi:molybdate transport system substrate-binding protein